MWVMFFRAAEDSFVGCARWGKHQAAWLVPSIIMDRTWSGYNLANSRFDCRNIIFSYIKLQIILILPCNWFCVLKLQQHAISFWVLGLSKLLCFLLQTTENGWFRRWSILQAPNAFAKYNFFVLFSKRNWRMTYCFCRWWQYLKQKKYSKK